MINMGKLIKRMFCNHKESEIVAVGIMHDISPSKITTVCKCCGKIYKF